jgi:thiosulfate/3-mercaptopyruvate sulfurtransferase
VRWALGQTDGHDRYRAGHIPGAVYVDLDRELAAPPSAATGRHPLPDAAAFQAAARRWGVTASSPTVVYDALGAMSAARAWWLLRWAGHTDVRILDGGWPAWVDAGLPVQAGEPDGVVPGDFVAVPGAMPVVDADGAVAVAARGILLDARAAERYRGDVEPIDARAGHIPGALSAPTSGNLTVSGRFLPDADLRARFAALGLVSGPPGEMSPPRAAGPGVARRDCRPGGSGELADVVGDEAHEVTGVATGQAGAVAVYCGSGVTAAHEIAALAAIGVTAALYPGSWSQWAADTTRPVAIGQ